ncbi:MULTISPECIES: hypothetical protein [Cronobacter]|uniref:hypothetical protein n=1 Tax=Cronobacter TaxID=413496 RepID=UPI0004978E40|nr:MULTISPECIES: hypothetical protein [Cronobacter]EDZ1273673.1 hypothetical protein [Salmonella enterica]AXW99284.2 hypothetical protein CsakCS931_35340 [Cronobacter sakazakii]EGT4410457.1 hypothetical protein [Cronobacter sakazakii]EGT5652448.1 hypothetical protein [Cronobacter sakazakii]EGT5749933.1 hypothetical protein [Cronobacter sakazakii]
MNKIKISLLLALPIFYSTAAFAAKPLTSEQQDYIKKTLEPNLLDPDSTKYQFPAYIDSEPTYCFKLNAVNAYGAYTGYRWVQIPYKSIVKMEKNVPVDLNVLPKEVFEESCKEIGYN